MNQEYINGLVSALKDSNAHAEDQKYRAKLEEVLQQLMKVESYRTLLEQDEDFNREYEIFLSNSNKEVKKPGVFKKLALAGITALVTLAGCSALKNSAALQKNSQEEVEIEDLKKEEAVNEDYAFDVNDREEIINHVSDFLIEAKKMGYEIDVDQALEMYAMANLKAIDVRTFNAFDFAMKNKGSMMESFRDFGIKVREMAMSSDSEYHFNLASLISNKEDSEALAKFEALVYAYNKSTNKKEASEAIVEYLHNVIIREHNVDSFAKYIMMELSYGLENASRNNKEGSLFHDHMDIYAILYKQGKESNEWNCNLVSEEGQSKISEEHATLASTLEAIINKALQLPKIEVDETIRKEIIERVSKVSLGEKRHPDFYNNSPYKNDNYHDMPYAGALTASDKIVYDANGNAMVIANPKTEAERQADRARQTAEQQAKNNDAGKTADSQSAARLGYEDGYAGRGSNPGQVSSEHADAYERGWSDGHRDYETEQAAKRKTEEPTSAPSSNPTPAPSSNPTPAPSSNPTPAPTPDPTPAPSSNPTPAPTPAPTPDPQQDSVKDVSGIDFGDSEEKIIEEEYIPADELSEEDKKAIEAGSTARIEQYKRLASDLKSAGYHAIAEGENITLTFTL